MNTSNATVAGPHQGQPVMTAGDPLDQAKAAMIMIHGKGSPAQQILNLASEFNMPKFAFLAPQASGKNWFLNNFMAPTVRNEPWLSSALATISELLEQTQKAGIPLERTILLGFSQGACLALEYAARNPRKYGGVVGMSGGLFGPDDLERDFSASLDGTPVFIGSSDKDTFIPKERAVFSAAILKKMGAEVNIRIYEGSAHLINRNEIDIVRNMMLPLTTPTPPASS